MPFSTEVIVVLSFLPLAIQVLFLSVFTVGIVTKAISKLFTIKESTVAPLGTLPEAA